MAHRFYWHRSKKRSPLSTPNWRPSSQTADKEPPKNGGAFQLTSAAGRSESGWIGTDGVIQIKNWNPEDTTATLEIFLQAGDLDPGSVELVSNMMLKSAMHETVMLHIGGMDPIVGTPEQQARAIQKILMNLGFYRSCTFDGNLTTQESKAAISNFQFFHGLRPDRNGDLVDEETHRTIVSEVKATIAREVARAPVPLVGRDLPLEFDCSLKYGELRDKIDISRGFVEPAALNQTQVQPLTILPRHFPEMAFVALSDSGTRQNPNLIRMRKESFIFLDTGRWLKTARNFSVIWGRHTYLCEWLREGGGQAVPATTDNRLDGVFFAAMNGHVVVWQHASAWWAPAEELDWSKLTVVIPDLHLMTGPTAKIFRGHGFQLDPELDLLLFAKALVNIGCGDPNEDSRGQLRDQLQVVQLGDAYDLWIGCEPSLWKPNETLKVELIDKNLWSCKESQCKGHAIGAPPCPSGRWACDRIPCDGHPSPPSPVELCPEYEIDQTDSERIRSFLFSCGRAKPHCDGHPYRAHAQKSPCANGIVSPGSVWYCSRIEPACPGHDNGADHCEEIDARKQIVKWVRDIQGVNSNWVEKLLAKRDGSIVKKDQIEKFGVPDGVDVDSDLSRVPGKSCLNPAVAALKLLHDHLPLVLLHGNHDNYLILADITDAAGISRRQHLWEQSGVLVEHGHRLEARLLSNDVKRYIEDAALATVGPLPIGILRGMEDYNNFEAGHILENQDGTVTGYNAARDEFHARRTRHARKLMKLGFWDNEYDDVTTEVGKRKERIADWTAQQFQQKGYQKETARIWLGRALNKQCARPHIFVMGHTHMPMLSYVEIDWRFGASATIKSCRVPDPVGY